MKKTLAIVAASILLVGALEDPAHSKDGTERQVDLLAMTYIASEVCQDYVGDVTPLFNEMMAHFILDYDLRKTEAANIIAVRSLQIAKQLHRAGAAHEFCMNISRGRF